jgi:hypothetical protein
MISPRRRAEKGVVVEGRRTTVFPAVRALRTSQKGMRKGKFQGEMTRVGPRGWKRKALLLL